MQGGVEAKTLPFSSALHTCISQREVLRAKIEQLKKKIGLDPYLIPYKKSILEH